MPFDFNCCCGTVTQSPMELRQESFSQATKYSNGKISPIQFKVQLVSGLSMDSDVISELSMLTKLGMMAQAKDHLVNA